MWLIAVTLRRRHCQALVGTLLYNISKALAGRLGAWMESEMSGVVSSLDGGGWTLSTSGSIPTV